MTAGDETSDRVPYLEYERARNDGTTFLIAPGHPSQGEVIERREDYCVVRKNGDGGEVARFLDPRKEEA